MEPKSYRLLMVVAVSFVVLSLAMQGVALVNILGIVDAKSDRSVKKDRQTLATVEDVKEIVKRTERRMERLAIRIAERAGVDTEGLGDAPPQQQPGGRS